MSPKPVSTPIALTVAGSDSGGGAGIQADLKTFAAHGVHGLSAIAALTAQSTTEVRGIFDVPSDFVALQLATLADDFSIGAMKTGMLSSVPTIEVVGAFVERHSLPLVVDPVMVAASGARLIDQVCADALVAHLFSKSLLITPNLDEAEVLVGFRPKTVAEMERAAGRLAERCSGAVLLKGGHLAGEPTDVLWCKDFVEHLVGSRIITRNTHGTGCTYAAAITAQLARGASLFDAVRAAHAYLRGAILHAPRVGRGSGPLHPLHQVLPMPGAGSH